MKLCGRPGPLDGAGACPREHGHAGPCWWWVFAFAGDWRAAVYSGRPPERVLVAQGRFDSLPGPSDVNYLLETLGKVRRREEARRRERRRNPSPVPAAAEPVPWSPERPAPTSRPKPEPALSSAADRAARLAAHRARAMSRP